MNEISIRFNQTVANTPIVIEVFNEKFQRIENMVTSQGIPARISVSHPGLYYVRAAMPTGERLGATVEVKQDMLPVTALLTASELVPQKGLEWAYLQQSVRNASGIALGDNAVETQFTPREFTIDGAYRMRSTSQSEGWHLRSDELEIDNRLDSFSHQDRRILTLFDVKVRSSNFSWKNTQLGPPSAEQVTWFPAYVQWQNRDDPDQTGFFVVPMSTQADATVIVVRTSGDLRIPLRPLVNSINSRAETLMSYLEQGDLRSATLISKVVLENATELLRDKRSDPFTACIAGYFFVRTGRLERQSWMRNLANWFNDIPDGAVVYGTSLLQTNSDEKRKEARTYFLRATRMGIPTYTLGLRLLFNGLRTLAEELPRDRDVQTALARIRLVATYADWGSRVTSFSIPSFQINESPFDSIF